jgi:hypothetical protein
MKCRQCGCTDARACTRRGGSTPTETCEWVKPGLCSACSPDAVPGWKHPTSDPYAGLSSLMQQPPGDR